MNWKSLSGRLCRGAFVATIAMTLAAVSSVRGDFVEPVLITEGEGNATGASLAIDGANNVWAISVENNRLVVDLIGPDLRERVELPDSGGSQSGPVAVSNCCGKTFIAFEQSDPTSSEDGREIFITDSSTSGGPFRDLTPLSQNTNDDHSPSVDLDINGNAHLVWEQERPAGSNLITYHNHETREQEIVDSGSTPDIALNQLDFRLIAHVVYTQRNDVWYSHNANGTFDTETKVVNTPGEPESNPRVVVDENNDIYVIFVVGGILKFVTKQAGGSFGPAQVIDIGPGITDPDITIRRNSVLTITYIKNNEVFVIQGTPTALFDAAVLGDAKQSRSSPNLVADNRGNLHAVFVDGGDVYYTNNAESVQASFTASPRSGKAPLEVQFQDLSNGDVAVWRWDFGDKTISSLQNPVHVYDRPQQYDVTLTVFNANRESTLLRERYITVQEADNTLEIPDQVVLPGQQDVWFPVIANHNEPMRGFQVNATYDQSILQFQECNLEFAQSRSLSAEFFECKDNGTHVEVGLLFDFLEPFEFRAIPPGDNHELLSLIFDVSPTASEGAVTSVCLVNDADLSRIFNLFVVDGFARFPVLECSTVTVAFENEEHLIFVRGDVDVSGKMNIGDAVQLLDFQFLGREQPKCLKAGDINDLGKIDISAPIAVLRFLFLGGAPPRPPFPNPGIDPTPDDLPCDI